MALQTNTREDWLTEALDHLFDGPLAPYSELRPPMRVSVGYPPGMRGSKSILGVCVNRAGSSDGTNEIFISPFVDDPTLAIGVLLHESLHALDDCQNGHKGAFAIMAKRIGMTGNLAQALPNEALSAELADVVECLGEYPHAKMNADTRKKQSTRMLKVECTGCGATMRMSQKWADRIDADSPCPCCADPLLVVHSPK